MRFDLLRVHIFSVGEHDDFLAPSGYEEIAAGIEVSEISGMEPAVAKYFRRRFRAIPVTLHHDRAANCNLTSGRRTVLQRLCVNDLRLDDLRLDDLRLDAGKRLPDRTKNHITRGVYKGPASSLGQSISIQNVDAKGVKILCNRRIEARTTRNQVAHARTESGMDFSE